LGNDSKSRSQHLAPIHSTKGVDHVVPVKYRDQNAPRFVHRNSIRSVEESGHGRYRGRMSRQPFLALRDVHIVCCHPQEPVADLNIVFVICAVSEFSSAP